MYRILDILQQRGQFFSGEEIGKSLGISRAAVWKGIQKLREEGYTIEAVTNKGYRLMPGQDIYNAQELTKGLATKRIGKPLHFYQEVGSTNIQIRELALAGAPEGTLAVAEVQTAGKGRRGRAWEAPGGSGVWMSFLLRPDIRPVEAATITLLAALAASEAIEEETGLSPQIKWPNDILLNDKKLVGILTEMECEMQETHFVVVGIGVNVNTPFFPEELQKIATSLFLEGGKAYSRKGILQRILLNFEDMYDEFLAAGCSFLPFLETYKNRCITLGKEIDILGRRPFSATAIDITPEGELVVRRGDTGEEEVVFSGEVSIRRRG